MVVFNPQDSAHVRVARRLLRARHVAVAHTRSDRAPAQRGQDVSRRVAALLRAADRVSQDVSS